MTIREAICVQHKLLSRDFVSHNAKKEPVFRCVAHQPDGARSVESLPHYFTVSAEAAARLIAAGRKAKR